MSFYQTLQQATACERERLFNAPIIEACRRGDISRDTYLAFLAQAYYHVRHTVPLLMATGGKLGQEYEWVRGAIREYIDDSTAAWVFRANDLRLQTRADRSAPAAFLGARWRGQRLVV